MKKNKKETGDFHEKKKSFIECYFNALFKFIRLFCDGTRTK